MQKAVTIYTDGACAGNPGPGGWAAILIYGGHRREMSGGYRLTTNNRMELMAVIHALEALRESCNVTVYSDSEYVVNSITKGWAAKWRASNWKRPKGMFTPNWELWQRLLELCGRHSVRIRWVEGHAGHEENERCDELAVAQAARPNLPPDVGYEQPPVPETETHSRRSME